MQLTEKLRDDITAAVRRLCGPGRMIEVSYRSSLSGEDVCNGLLWRPDAELVDLTILAHVDAIEEDPAHAGMASLDLYVSTADGLETNCYAFVRDGAMVGFTAEWAGDCRELGLRTLGVVPFAEEE